jgi:hypothetical protein
MTRAGHAKCSRGIFYALTSGTERQDDDSVISVSPFLVEVVMRQSWLLAAFLLLVGRAQAGPLDPNSFPSLGTLNLTSGSYTVNTDTLSLTGSGVNLTGVLSSPTTGSVAVFDFNSISIGFGVTLTATGSHPLALLSRGSAIIYGTLNVNGVNGDTTGTGGPGGGSGGVTGDGGGPGGGGLGGSGGGGGFGGKGGDGHIGGFGGSAYGDLTLLLQGGSGGGGDFIGGGGGGGGGLEIGVTTRLTINSTLDAYGGNGDNGAGGGSGGGIFLHGQSVSLLASASLEAGGGAGSGGGGGGRVLVEFGSGGFTNSGSMDISGGFGFNIAGDNDVFTSQPLVSSSPEPSSVVLLALGGLALAACRQRRAGRGP